MKILPLALMLTTMTANAVTIDDNRFFAYLHHYQIKQHVLLSDEKCPISETGWKGYAQTVWDIDESRQTHAGRWTIMSWSFVRLT